MTHLISIEIDRDLAERIAERYEHADDEDLVTLADLIDIALDEDDA